MKSNRKAGFNGEKEALRVIYGIRTGGEKGAGEPVPATRILLTQPVPSPKEETG